MNKQIFRSGLRAGLTCLIASVIFTMLIFFVYFREAKASDFPHFMLFPFLLFATLPSLISIPAIVKKVEISFESQGIRITDRSLYSDKEFFVTNEMSVTSRLRIFVAGNGKSRIDLNGDVNCSIGRGLIGSDLEKLHETLKAHREHRS